MSNFDVEKVFEEGDTNDVFLTGEGTVVKKFSKVSFPAVAISLVYMFTGYPRFFTRDNRMDNEKEIRTKNQHNLEFPAIISAGEKFMEFEYIEGKSLKEKAENPDECEEMGKLLGNAMEGLQSENIFLVDYSLDNFILTGEDLYHIDPEYSGFRNSKANRLMDILSLLFAFKILPPENYRNALQGLESVRGSTSFLEMFLANSVALLYAVFLGSRAEFSNSVKNFKR